MNSEKKCAVTQEKLQKGDEKVKRCRCLRENQSPSSPSATPDRKSTRTLEINEAAAVQNVEAGLETDRSGARKSLFTVPLNGEETPRNQVPTISSGSNLESFQCDAAQPLADPLMPDKDGENDCSDDASAAVAIISKCGLDNPQVTTDFYFEL